ncbi:MAG: hypothetical protein ACR2OC_03425 [Solirubrobacterales bacterium]
MSGAPKTPIPPKGDPWRDNELVRRARLREDAKRPLGVNLADALEHSGFMIRIAGSALRK